MCLSRAFCRKEIYGKLVRGYLQITEPSGTLTAAVLGCMASIKLISITVLSNPRPTLALKQMSANFIRNEMKSSHPL